QDVLYVKLDRLFQQHDVDQVALDPRVVQVVQLIKSSVADNLSVGELANEVRLSVPRLVQLFKRQVGVPIRRYRQWHRIYVTAVAVASGRSLTDAAITAGFTDSSHFSNTFRTLLGMKPSNILSHLEHIQIIAPTQPKLNARTTQRMEY